MIKRKMSYRFEIGHMRPDGLLNVWTRARVWPMDAWGPGTWVIVYVAGSFEEALEWIRRE